MMVLNIYDDVCSSYEIYYKMLLFDYNMMFEQEIMVDGNSSDHLWSILIRLHVKL